MSFNGMRCSILADKFDISTPQRKKVMIPGYGWRNPTFTELSASSRNMVIKTNPNIEGLHHMVTRFL